MTQLRGAALAAAEPGALRVRVSSAIASDRANAVSSWLLSFVFVLALGADSGGYWPTAWNWTALSLLVLSALILILQQRVRIGTLEGMLPAALLALTVWGVVSVAWSVSATQPLLQSQRTLAYAAAALTALLLVRGRSYRPLLGGVWAAITLVCGYSLLTRLFPERYGFVDSIAGYRLEAPLGYWNALGIFAAMGVLIAVGFAARGNGLVVRALAAGSTVIIVPTLYFTFSRGAWVAVAAGIVTMVALDARRLQLVSVVAVVAPFPAIAVWHASHTPLARLGDSVAASEHAGRHLSVYLLVLALCAAAVAVAFALLERRVQVPRPVRIGYALVLVLVLLGLIVAVSARYGSPPTMARKAYDSLVGPAANVTNGNLNTRLDSLALGERIPQWHVAWHEYLAHPWLGSGLGSYVRYWDQHRTNPFAVLNVHNLYLETLAELGPIGLALLLVALAVPLVAAVKARRRSVVPAAAGAYVAFLVHSAVDWDWQMPAVTLAALFCGVVLLVAARGEPDTVSMPRLWRGAALGLVVLLAAAAFVGLRGNDAIAASQHAATKTDWVASAADARAARFWAPWSSEPWQLLGEAQTAMGDQTAARASLARALAKDGQDWSIWLDLAIASSGAHQRQALAVASRLNPVSPEIAAWKALQAGAHG